MSIDKPENTHRVFAEAARAGSLEPLVALYEPDAVIVERDGALSIGTKAIRAHLEHLLALEPSMSIDASWAVTHGEIALLCSRWSAQIRTPDGRISTIEARGSEIVRRQRDGTWKLVVDNPWGVEVDTASVHQVGV